MWVLGQRDAPETNSDRVHFIRTQAYLVGGRTVDDVVILQSIYILLTLAVQSVTIYIFTLTS